jgi:uncharacterized protein (UPF0335 family)
MKKKEIEAVHEILAEKDWTITVQLQRIQRLMEDSESERIKQQLREIHHYYADSGSDQKYAKQIVKVLEEHFEWLKPKDD